jgi:hypothetical protein
MSSAVVWLCSSLHHPSRDSNDRQHYGPACRVGATVLDACLAAWWIACRTTASYRLGVFQASPMWVLPAGQSFVRAEGGGIGGPGSVHGDDDLAACVSVLQVAQARSGVGQGEGAVEERRELPGLDERGDGEQVFAVPLVR